MTIQTEMRSYQAGLEHGHLDYVITIQGRPVLFDTHPDPRQPCVVGYTVDESGNEDNGHVSAILVAGLSERHVNLLMGLNSKDICDPDILVEKEAFGFYNNSFAGTSPVLRIKDAFLKAAYDNSSPLVCCQKFGKEFADTDDIVAHMGALKLPYESVMENGIVSGSTVSEEVAALHMFNYVRALLDVN